MTGEPGDGAGGPRSQRISAFDGLRGIACGLVVASHLWVIVPDTTLDRLGPLRGLSKAGNFGVSMFFVMGSFLITQKLLASLDRSHAVSVEGFWSRRLVRLGSQLAPLLAVLWIVSRFDRWDSYPADMTTRSVMGVGTFTFNWTLVNQPLSSRNDLGHLWYLSVEQQFYVVWIGVLVWFGRYRRMLVAVLATAAIGCMVWRWYVVDTAGWWQASLRTSTRADGLCLGALAAMATPALRRLHRWASWVGAAAAATVVVVVLTTPLLDELAFLRAQGILLVVAVTTLISAVAVADSPRGPVERFLSLRAFRALGAISWPLFLWHLPVFYAANRWARNLEWFPRAALAIAALTLVTAATYAFIERPVTRWLGAARRSVLNADGGSDSSIAAIGSPHRREAQSGA